MTARPVLARDGVIVACAIGAGAAAGGGFAVPTVVLGAAAVALTWRRRGAIPLLLTALIAVFSAFVTLAVSNGHGPHDQQHEHATVHGHAPQR